MSGGYYQVKVMSGALSYKTTDALSSHSSGLGTQCIYSSYSPRQSPPGPLISRHLASGLRLSNNICSNGLVVMLALCSGSSGRIVCYFTSLWSPPSWWSLTLGERCPPTVQQFLEDKLVTDLHNLE